MRELLTQSKNITEEKRQQTAQKKEEFLQDGLKQYNDRIEFLKE